MSTSADLAQAIEHHRSGRLPEAEAAYRQILEADPRQVDALQLLGLIAHQAGRFAMAVEYLSRAVAVRGDVAMLQNNLGVALKDLGKLDEAAACYRRALELKPDFAEAHNNLGVVHREQGRLDEAAACCRQALEIKPDYAEAHSNLGNALKLQGSLDEAVAAYGRAIELKPDFAEAHYNLGNALNSLGKLDEAAACYRRALELKPAYAEAHNNLGNVLRDQGQSAAADVCYRRALALNPDFAQAHYNLGNVLKDQGQLDAAVASLTRALQLRPDYPEAITNLGVALRDLGKLDAALLCYRRAIELAPESAAVHNNLGSALKDQGDLDGALAAFRKARELQPDYDKAHSNLVYTQLFHPACDAKALFEEHRRWNELHVAPLTRMIRPRPYDRSAGRRLRVGYVSPDFRNHVVGRNLLPLLREHDHQQFEVFCYADVPRPDEITGRFWGYADTWCETGRLTDEELAQRIAADRIDILVDTTLHMARNRLLAFARKPAPVQVTFAGYPGTTGLTTIDYRLTDGHLDPPGLFDGCYAEESVRLPDSFWCYDPPQDDPEVNALPAAARRHITFGCLNNFCKINAPVLKIWARVLRAVDGSHLVMLTGEGTHRSHTLELLAAEGIQRGRVTFVAGRPRRQYLGYYHDIDIGLDTVPYNGHTTSLDSLWMGVPVVTLVGATVVGRAGLSQLMNLGVPELIAHTAEQYVAIAAELAHDKPRLGQLRASLRDRMLASPLMDAPRFARNVEAAYGEMWGRGEKDEV